MPPFSLALAAHSKWLGQAQAEMQYREGEGEEWQCDGEGECHLSHRLAALLSWRLPESPGHTLLYTPPLLTPHPSHQAPHRSVLCPAGGGCLLGHCQSPHCLSCPQEKLSLALSCWQQCLAADLGHTHSHAHILPALQNCCVVYKTSSCAEACAAMRRLELQVTHCPTPCDGYSVFPPHRLCSARLPPTTGHCLPCCGRVREGLCLLLRLTAHRQRQPTARHGRPCA